MRFWQPGEQFMRDFFNMKPAVSPGYEWITVEQRPTITDNQGTQYRTPLFENWIKEGWEVVSVTPFPSASSIQMCRAIGVLRRARQQGERQ